MQLYIKMFGSKYTRQDLRNAAHKVKSQLGTRYNQSREVLGRLDDGVQTVKRVHTFVAPLINHTREGRILNNNLTKATNSYDTIRDRVINGDRAIQSTAHVIGGLQKLGVHIGL